MLEFPHFDYKRTPITLVIAAFITALEIILTMDETLRNGSLRESYYINFFGITNQIWLGQPWRPFTATLMHANLLHAAFNVYWFLIFGPILEKTLGSLRYLAAVILLGYASMMLEYVIGSYNRLDPVMIVGLSGVVYGMFGMLYVGRKYNIEMAEVCTEETKRILIGWFFLCIVLTYLRIMLVANLAHGTGFVFGVVYGYAAFGTKGRIHLGWLAAAGGMTFVVLAMLIACPGHGQYEQARKWKEYQILRRGVQGVAAPARPAVLTASRVPSLLKTAGVTGLLPGALYARVMVTGEVDPVEAGREGFFHRWHDTPPWYDGTKDGVKPVELSKPWWDQWDWGKAAPRDTGKKSDTAWLRVVGWTAVSLLAIFVVYVLIRYFRTGMFAENETIRRNSGIDKHRIEALPFPMQSFDGNLLEAASQHYRAGRLGEATKFLFSYQLVELDRARFIRLNRGKTNRRYLRELSGQAAMRSWVEETMVAFEEYFFGQYEIERSRFDRYWSRLPEFQKYLQRLDHSTGESRNERMATERQQTI